MDNMSAVKETKSLTDLRNDCTHEIKEKMNQIETNNNDKLATVILSENGVAKETDIESSVDNDLPSKNEEQNTTVEGSSCLLTNNIGSKDKKDTENDKNIADERDVAHENTAAKNENCSIFQEKTMSMNSDLVAITDAQTMQSSTSNKTQNTDSEDLESDQNIELESAASNDLSTLTSKGPKEISPSELNLVDDSAKTYDSSDNSHGIITTNLDDPTPDGDTESSVTVATNSATNASQPPVKLRTHTRHVRNTVSVLSCPEAVNRVLHNSVITVAENGRRHSMDLFEGGQRLRRKRGYYKRTDISGPICSVGDGPSSTIKVRPIRSASSESNIVDSTRVSSLSVNLDTYTLNDENQEPLVVTWDITTSISSLDCISLYLRKEDEVPELVSFRNAGVGYMPKGEIKWDLNQHQEKFTADKSFIVFKYYHPTSTGGLSLVASSEQITVHKKAVTIAERESSMRGSVTSQSSNNSELTTLVLSGLCGYNLKRGVFFNPDPYVKIAVFPGPRLMKQPHHKQMYRTKQAGNTINPVWKEHFIIQALPTDLVELEVRDRFDRSRPILRRFLGRLLIPLNKLQDVIEQGEERYTEALTKRSPLDQTSGSLSFLVTTTNRHPSFMRLPVGLSSSSISRTSTQRSNILESTRLQISTEDENYSSDGSNGNSSENIGPTEYAPAVTPDLPNGSAVIEREVEPETALVEESAAVASKDDDRGNKDGDVTDDEPTTDTAVPHIDEVEGMNGDKSNQKTVAVGESVEVDIPKLGTNVSPCQTESKLINQSGSGTSSQQGNSPLNLSPNLTARSPMRQKRLGAVSFFPPSGDSEQVKEKDIIPSHPKHVSGASSSETTTAIVHRIPSLKDMSLKIIEKTSDVDKLSQEGVSKQQVTSFATQTGAKELQTKNENTNRQTSRRRIPSLARLSSVELARYGAVGGARALESLTNSSDASGPKDHSEATLPDTAEAQSTSTQKTQDAVDGPTAAQQDVGPVNEMLSVSIQRNTATTNLGLSIVGGSKNNITRAHPRLIRVTKVEPGSPAALAGVQIGDRILSVNDTNMVNVDHSTAVSAIRNSGTEVLMQIERPLNAAAKRKYSVKSSTRPGSGNATQRLNHESIKRRASSPLTMNQKATGAKISGHSNRFSMPVGPLLAATSEGVKLPNVSSAFDAKFRSSRHRILSRTDITPENERPTQDGLPEHWEACRDRHGRIFYVDHENRTTQWNHPTHSPNVASSSTDAIRLEAANALSNSFASRTSLRRRNSAAGDRHYESAMKRYQSIKRAMKRQKTIGENPEEEAMAENRDPVEESSRRIHSPVPPTVTEDDEDMRSSSVLATMTSEAPGTNTVATNSSSKDDVPDSRSEDVPDSRSEEAPEQAVGLSTPACRFLTHTGFFNLLSSNEEAFGIYESSALVKYMVTKIARDKRHFLQYQHNKDLVKFINCFSDSTILLPQGWESKKDSSGKTFFIDHNLKLTTFIDPRLPLIDHAYGSPRTSARDRSAGSRERPGGSEDSDTRQAERAPVQSPLAGQQPQVPPRPESTLTNRSRILDNNNANAGPEPPPRDLPTAYNEKVVAFLQQANIIEILKERHPEVGTSESMKERIMIIRTEGVAALERLSHSVNLAILLSKFEDEIMNFIPKTIANRSVFAETTATKSSPSHGSPSSSSHEITKAVARSRAPAPHRRDFESKLHNFYRKLEQKGYGKGPYKTKMPIRRDHLLEDAFSKVTSLSRKELQRNKLNITFAGEEGLDYSGPSREFFFLVSRELFNPYYGLFEYSAVDTYTVQISPMSNFINTPLEWFRFAGRIIGLALIHHYLLDAFFTRPLYKAILRAKCDISDLQYIDEQFYQSIMWMKDNDITDVLDLTFTVDQEVFGQIVEKELKPNGKNIPVTEKNKKEYIERIAKWRVNRSTREQTNQLVRGCNEVIDIRLMSVFDAHELELVLCGTAEIDLNDWRQNTEYRGGYHDLHPVIQWFWEALENFDNERRLRLLQFVTGTSSIPYEGFTALRGPNGPKKFCIEKWGKSHFLPRAHTCFNRIDLPSYLSYQVLWEKLVIAIEETSTFGME